MVRYELLKEMRNMHQLVGAGIVSISMVTKLQVYETYLELLKTSKKPQAIKDTADYYNFSDSQIYKVITFMEST